MSVLTLRRIAAWVLIAAGAAGIVGSFAPWARVHRVAFVSGTVYGTDGTVDADGEATVALMAVVVLMGLAALAARRARAWPGVVALVAGAVAGLLVWADADGLDDGAGSLPSGAVDLSWGVVLVGVAAAAAAVAALGVATPVRSIPASVREQQGVRTPL